jgi:ABC-type transport system involved in multi-copper enzyme maturation permease subunit
MIWLTWRQFRAQALTAVGILAAAAIYFLITGAQLRHTYTADLASCTPPGNCDSALSQFRNSYNAAFNLTQFILIAAPALIGIFWGAPLIGRELENGTDQLVWNQTVTRTRWLAVKLTIVGVASIATAGILSCLATWWAGPLDRIGGDRFAAITFSSRDIVPLAYAAFAFALGTTAGLVLRRTVPAMAVTLAVFIGIQILVPTLIRPNLLPSTTTTFAINQTTIGLATSFTGIAGNFHFQGVGATQGAWVLSAPPVENSSGQVVYLGSYTDCFPPQPPQGQGARPAPGATKGSFFDFPQIGACLASHDLHQSVTYQPASHYWPLQWAETGIFLALAAALSGTCFWRIRRRQN